MRFGILYNKNNVNIGDDIQTYALKKFLPQVDYFIDSEHLDDFVTDNKETCAVIMNYNYSWAKWNWPPSRYIYPFFTSFYYGDYEKRYLQVTGPVVKVDSYWHSIQIENITIDFSEIYELVSS